MFGQYTERVVAWSIATALIVVLVLAFCRAVHNSGDYIDQCVLEGNTPTVCVYMARHRNVIEMLW